VEPDINERIGEGWGYLLEYNFYPPGTNKINRFSDPCLAVIFQKKGKVMLKVP
jgi:hypothetical protein